MKEELKRKKKKKNACHQIKKIESRIEEFEAENRYGKRVRIKSEDDLIFNEAHRFVLFIFILFYL